MTPQEMSDYETQQLTAGLAMMPTGSTAWDHGYTPHHDPLPGLSGDELDDLRSGYGPIAGSRGRE